LIAGCVYALPDLTASFVRKETVGSDVLLTARIGNGGGNAVGPEVPVSFYNGDPASGGILLGTARTESIAARSFEDVSLMVPVGTEALPLWVVADDEGGLIGIHTESNEANNAVDGQVYLTSTPNEAPVVDAGPDQIVTIEGASLVVPLSGSEQGCKGSWRGGSELFFRSKQRLKAVRLDRFERRGGRERGSG
jgi:hypothetical protein